MIEIAICDDEEIVTSEIEQRLHTISKKSGVEINVDVFFEGKALTDYIISHGSKYALIYMDIAMRGENGIETARRIRKIDKNVLLIYVTNYESYAKDVFEVSAFRFITKPISDSIFEKYFLSAVKEIKKTPHFFKFQYDKVRYTLPLNEIAYFQSDKRITYIYGGQKVLKCYEKLNSIENRLKESGIEFFRIHQSFLVNPAYVEMYKYNSMRLMNGTVLSISVSRRQSVNALYCKLKGDSIIV